MPGEIESPVIAHSLIFLDLQVNLILLSHHNRFLLLNYEDFLRFLSFAMFSGN